MIYDSTLNVTWLADTHGRMNWADAHVWSNSLVHAGFDDWRLPEIAEPIHLFVDDFGTKPTESVLNPTGGTAEQIANLALFPSVREDIYWAGTPFSPGQAWGFDALLGEVGVYGDDWAVWVLAVRPDDVAAATVPEPRTLALTLLALGGTLLARGRRPG